MADVFSAESRLIHAGTERVPGRPATPPLAPASIYVSQGTPRPGRGYGRDGNPGWEALEQALGGLEDAEAVAFASGQAASMALMLALTPGRERIVLPEDGYYGGRVLADRLRPHSTRPVPVDLRDQLRRGRVNLGTACPVAGRDRPGRPDPAVGRRGARRGPDHRHRPRPGGAVMRRAVGNYELDDDPARIDPAAAAAFLTTEAYWGRWRTEQDVGRQIAAAWRVTGAYDAAGAMVGLARAISDGGSAYLADVYVLPAHRGRGLGKAIVAMMIEAGPGAGFRWMLHTSDAYGLYRQFGFGPPPDNYMERSGGYGGRTAPP